MTAFDDDLARRMQNRAFRWHYRIARVRIAVRRFFTGTI